MESRQLPPIPMAYGYDKTETDQPRSSDDGHEMHVRPLPPVPPSTGIEDDDSLTEEDTYVRLKKTKSNSVGEDPYSTVKSKNVEDPYSTIKNKYTEDPYSKVKSSAIEEDPYSSIKDIRKSKASKSVDQAEQLSIIIKDVPRPQHITDDEDPYSTVNVKQDSKSNVVIQVSSPTANRKLSIPPEDLTSAAPGMGQVDAATDEAKRTAPITEFKANITPDLYAARKLYQSRRSIANQWTSYNVTELFEEVGGDDESNRKSKKKVYDPTDIYVNLHKYRLQNNKLSPSNQNVNTTNETEDTLNDINVKQRNVDESGQSQIDGNLAVNQHKFYQSIKDVQDSYQKLKSKIR